MAARGVFAGLCTFDLIQRVERVPGPDEKVTAGAQVVAAGGPATNAAATFAHLGGEATLITGVGGHPLTAGITADLHNLGVRVVDLAAGDLAPPSVSSILVTAATGTRSVVSRNAAGRSLVPPADLAALVAQADVVLVDGHHPALARAVLTAARHTLTVLDGGSWKPHLPGLLPLVDVAVCSADLRPPDGGPAIDHLHARGVPWVAVTDGPRPIRWSGPGGYGRLAVPAVDAVDTTGAGDVFHGAFAYAVAGTRHLDRTAFTAALARAATVAAASCRAFGTREWMTTDRLE